MMLYVFNHAWWQLFLKTKHIVLQFVGLGIYHEYNFQQISILFQFFWLCIIVLNNNMII